jgi:hypothetical protein
MAAMVALGMETRSGTFRIRKQSGHLTFRYRATASTLSVRVATSLSGARFAWRLRLGQAPSYRWAFRPGGQTGGQERPGDWDLQPSIYGNDTVVSPFLCILGEVGLGEKEATSPERLRLRHFWLRVLKALSLEAYRRTDPVIRSVAQQFNPSLRFWVYQAIASDRSGRVLGMVQTSPGLLIVAHELQRLASPKGRAGSRRLLRGIAAGWGLGQLLRLAAQESLTLTIEHHWAHIRDAKRLLFLSRAERERAIEARCLLIANACTLVSGRNLVAEPPSAFDAGDIPSGPTRNADWYGAMHAAGPTLHEIPESSLREAFWSFVSANHRLVTRWLRRTWTGDEGAKAGGPGSVKGGLTWLLRYARATGRFPNRTANPRQYLADCELWRWKIERN